MWDTSLSPNDYYLNRDAYDVTLVSTRVTALEFKGGFTRRYLDLKVDAKGDFTQTERTATFPQPKDAADIGDQHQDRGLGNPAGTARDRPDHAGKRADRRGGGGRTGGGRPAHPGAFDPLAGAQCLRRLDRRQRAQRQRRAGRCDASDPRARHHRKSHGPRTGDPRARADRRSPRRRRHQGDSSRANRRYRRNCCWPGSANSSPGNCAPPTSRNRWRRSSARRPNRRAPPPTSSATSSTAQTAVKVALLAQDRRQAEGHAERLYLEEQAAGQTAQAEVLGKDSVLQAAAAQAVLRTARRPSGAGRQSQAAAGLCRRRRRPGGRGGDIRFVHEARRRGSGQPAQMNRRGFRPAVRRVEVNGRSGCRPRFPRD